MNKSWKVRGLLDRARPSSLGMLALIVEEGHCFRTAGVLGSQAGSIGSDDFEELVSSKQALRIDICVETDAHDLAALWVGNDFEVKAAASNLALPPLPAQFSGRVPNGRFWIASTQHVYRVIDSWLVRAFQSSVLNEDRAIADLMSCVLPDRDETRSARWLTASVDERNKLLSWWERLERGRAQRSAQQLESLCRALVTGARALRLGGVVGFCAPAKAGDNKIAAEAAKQAHVRRLSFGDWLRIRSGSRGSMKERVELQRLGDDLIKKEGALTFCLRVLSDIPITHKLPNETFVIDGIRHIDIYRSLQSLVGPERCSLAYVDRSIELRRRLLRDQEGFSEPEVDVVLGHPTEKEIPRLQENADPKLTVRIGEDAIHDAKQLLEEIGFVLHPAR